MSIPLTINGAVFEYPVDFDENWGVDATGWAQAVTNGMLQMAGGSFPLTADVNFGPNFGLLSKYFETRSSFPATVGTIRLSPVDAGIAWRNFAHSGNNILTTDASDNLQYNGSTISGGVNAGTQYKLGYYATTSSNISPNPNTMAATQVLVTDANGVPTTTGNGGTTATEIGYVNGVTSSIQTQLNSQQTQINARVTSVSGTANQITSTGGTTPVLAIANPLTLPGPMTAGGTIAMGTNKITGLGNGTAAQDAAAFGQIYYGFQAPVQSTNTGSTSTTSSTFQDTSLTASITPTSSAHRIKVTVSGNITNTNGSQTATVTLKRGASNLGGAQGFLQYQNNASTSNSTRTGVSFSYVDSPATTSSTTYTVQINANNAQTVTWNENGVLATIILEEIV